MSVQSLGQYSSVWLGQASLVCSLSHKLWCYSRISSPEKSHNNSCKKNTIFFLCVFDIANQLLTHHSPFASLSQVDKWMAKPSPFSILGCLLQFFWIMASKTLKNPCANFSRRGRKPKYRKKNQKLCNEWLW